MFFSGRRRRRPLPRYRETVHFFSAKWLCEHNTGGASPSPIEMERDPLFVSRRKIVRTMKRTVEDACPYRGLNDFRSLVRSRKIVRTRIRTPHPSAFGCHLPPLGKALDKCEQRCGGSKPPPYECYLICSAFPWRSVFPSSNLTVPYHIPLAVYFLPTSLSKLRWQSIFIPAQGSSDTIKTVGGEAVRRFFSLKYAVLLYTLSTLFREPRFAPAKTFQESFLLSFFSKKRQRIPASSHPPASLRRRRA